MHRDRKRMGQVYTVSLDVQLLPRNDELLGSFIRPVACRNENDYQFHSYWGVGLSRKRHSVAVAEVQDLSPRVRRIRFSGETLTGLTWSPGDKVKLRLRGVSRSYTPAMVDEDQGWMDVIFFLHGRGPATRWAAGAGVGTRAMLTKPEKSFKRGKKEPAWALFMGDETTLGLAQALLSALPSRTVVMGAIEITAGDAPAVQGLGLPLSVAIRDDHYGDALVDWLTQATLPEGDGVIWISGEAVTVRTLKKVLSERDLGKTSVKTKGYWKAKRRSVHAPTESLRIAAK